MFINKMGADMSVFNDMAKKVVIEPGKYIIKLKGKDLTLGFENGNVIIIDSVDEAKNNSRSQFIIDEVDLEDTNGYVIKNIKYNLNLQINNLEDIMDNCVNEKRSRNNPDCYKQIPMKIDFTDKINNNSNLFGAKLKGNNALILGSIFMNGPMSFQFPYIRVNKENTGLEVAFLDKYSAIDFGFSDRMWFEFISIDGKENFINNKIEHFTSSNTIRRTILIFIIIHLIILCIYFFIKFYYNK